LIEWTAGVGARHATSDQCAAAKAAKRRAEVKTLDLKPVAEFLQRAKDKGLPDRSALVKTVQGFSDASDRMASWSER
jgi:hypothetical protein